MLSPIHVFDVLLCNFELKHYAESNIEYNIGDGSYRTGVCVVHCAIYVREYHL
jgi:hypothetical protein